MTPAVSQRVLRLLGLLAWCAACVDPVSQLVATADEPPGEHCPHGGVAIQTGTDANDNGVLESDEVSATSYLCQPGAPPRQLVRVVAEPAGANCANGGQSIAVGLDLDFDNVLDDSEVTSTSYVCAGPAGTQTLIAVVPEPAGANCAHGGQAIEVGPDTNHNNALDSDEITSRSYVCAPSAGQNSLLRVDVEPSGVNCQEGGSAIHSGLDANDDGVLQNSEIQSTTYLCGTLPLPTIIIGEFVIKNHTDVARLSAVTTITGNLILDIHAQSFPPINLPSLVTLGGALITECSYAPLPCNRFSAVSAPNLVSAAFIYLDAKAMASIDLSSLVEADRVQISYGQLSELVLPEYTSGELAVSANPGMVTVAAPKLVDGGVSLHSIAASSLSFPSLQAGGFGAGSMPNLTSISVPLLETATYLNVSGNPMLTSVSFPILSSMTSWAQVEIEQNASLQSFSAPHLTDGVSYLSIKNNPMFPTCRAQQLATQWSPATVIISGNDDAATCP